MYTLFSNRLLMAESSSHGTLVAPKTRTSPEECPTPSICTKNSVLIRLDESASPSECNPQSESTSSIKIIAGRILVHSSNRVTLERSETALQAISCISAFILYIWPFTSFFMYHVTTPAPLPFSYYGHVLHATVGFLDYFSVDTTQVHETPERAQKCILLVEDEDDSFI